MSSFLQALKQETSVPFESGFGITRIYQANGYRAHFDDPNVVARAYASAEIFRAHKKYIYPHDRIAGTFRGRFLAFDKTEAELANSIVESYGELHFTNNVDHYAPDYGQFLHNGIKGTLENIRISAAFHAADREKSDFLRGAAITMEGFSDMISQYAELAEATAVGLTGEEKSNMEEIALACRHVATEPPANFREALQLTWLCYIAFVFENRYAMAFGRMDQYLYPFYKADVEAGRLDAETATEWLACTLYKIAENGNDDVVNIAIGGVKRDGSCAVNELSYCLLEAVKRAGVPGPNLSARIAPGVPDEFLDKCLEVIGTGIGYPALMNDEVNIAALRRMGYALEDCRDYCMVGCIENFMPGLQPPWSDNRYNSPKYLEYALNDGRDMQTGVQRGPHTGKVETIPDMETLMERLHTQMVAGAAEYMAFFRNENRRYNPVYYQQPFLSCFTTHCIERGLDVNMGGTKYPSAHGPGCMGVGTMADSLAAIDTVIFTEKKATLSQLRDALLADYQGYEELQAELLAAPKYGNNDDRADKYAVWFVKESAAVFEKYRTPDGGRLQIGIASNVQNISAGHEVAATPDGRRSGKPLSDAASPTYGRDRNGPTSTVLSVTKPDYTCVACGTVVNQKYSPSMFSVRENRDKLRSLIRVYFSRGGQEMQINSISRKVLMDAMEHPDMYESLVVRVSGFSAYYNSLSREVKEDILNRTEQG